MMQQKSFDGFDVAVDNKAKLEAKFIIPPFSVFDTRQGYWQERKRLWLALGIQSEIGRGQDLLNISEEARSHYKNAVAVGRADNLTYGDSEVMRHPTLNYYRDKNKQQTQAIGRGDNLLGHSDTSINIDFYSQKRKLEKEVGKELTTQEAELELSRLGRIRLVNKSSRQEADKRSNVTGAPLKPEWAVGTGTTNMAPGTSIFDPVLCELVYKWFCPDGGHILDPFAGGSVRGIVASVLNRAYTGIDLSEEQVSANKEQAKEIVPDKQPEWILGDAYEVESLLPIGKHYDLVFS